MGPLELIAELFGYMLKRLDIASDSHDVDEGFRAEFRGVVEGVHFTQQGGIRLAPRPLSKTISWTAEIRLVDIRVLLWLRVQTTPPVLSYT